MLNTISRLLFLALILPAVSSFADICRPESDAHNPVESYKEVSFFFSEALGLRFIFRTGQLLSVRDNTIFHNTHTAFLDIDIKDDELQKRLITPVDRPPDKEDFTLYYTLLQARNEPELNDPLTPEFHCLGTALKRGYLPPVMAEYNHTSPESDSSYYANISHTAIETLNSRQESLNPDEKPDCRSLLDYLEENYQLGWKGVASPEVLHTQRGVGYKSRVSYKFLKGDPVSERHVQHLFFELAEKLKERDYILNSLEKLQNEIIDWITASE